MMFRNRKVGPKMNNAIVRIGHCFLSNVLIAIRDVGEDDKKRRL